MPDVRQNNDATPAEEEDQETDMFDMTTSTETRLAGLTSILAFIIVAGFVSLILLGATNVVVLGAIPSAWFNLFQAVVYVAVGWAFGVNLIGEYYSRKQS